MSEIISGIYKITNTVTKDFYIGSSKNLKQRWTGHKKPSIWKRCSNNPMYLDMQKYGVDKFVFEILEVVEPDKLKETEQQFIEMMKPIYNSNNANGLNIERKKEYQKEYEKTDKYKKSQKKYKNQLCSYNNEILTLHALSMRFMRQGIPHPTKEAKKYLVL